MKGINIGPFRLQTQITGIPPKTTYVGTSLRIGASTKFGLLIKDAKSDEIIAIFNGKGSSVKNWVVDNVYCSFGYSSPIGEAMSIAFQKLLKETEKGLIPPDLSVSAQFSDRNSLFPNNVLDVDEEAEIVITTKNNGKGIGYGTNLKVISDNPKITIGRSIKVGNIPPGETKDIRVNLKAVKDIGDGSASFKLNLKEKRGYNAKEVILNVPTSNQINKVIDSIIAKAIPQINQKGWKRIAMAEIGSHTGSYTNLEGYLIEEFYARLANMKEFSVVEKPLLNQALIALKTNFSDLVSPASEKVLVNHDAVKKVGVLTGADVIFMVTVTDMEDLVRINNIFVDIETGEVYMIAGEDIGKRRPL